MKKRDRLTVSRLAALTGRELDDTLLTLWDAGINEVNEPADELIGMRLELAKRVLSLPTSKQLTSLSYWQRVLSLDEMQLRSLLNELGFPMSKNARKLPKGAIRKLESKTNKKTSIPIQLTVQPSAEAPEPTPRATVDALDWKTVGRVREIRLLSLEEVLKIHFTLVSDFAKQEDPIDPPGPRNDDIIASAVFRQHTSIGNKSKYPSIEMSAAALIHSLVHDHPFHNGNKRTALVSTLVLLDENGLMLTCPEDELFKFVLQVAQHKIVDQNMDNVADREVLAIAEWFRERTRAVERGDRPLPFRRLRSILTAYGCSLEHSRSGSNMKITRTVQRKGFFLRATIYTTNISHGGEGREVPCATINKIRADLHLDEEDGVDSAAFYADFPFVVGDFIVKYRKTLNRLARL